MNSRIAVFTLVLAALSGVESEASTQEPPSEATLAEALALFHRHSPALQVARSQLRGSVGSALQSRATPNPAASFTHEGLGGYSESYVLLSQELDFLWERSPRADRAAARTTAATARFDADSIRLTADLKRTFVEAWARREAVETLRRAQLVVGEVLTDAEARVSEGDLAGYDLRRLRWEHARMARRAAVAELDLEDAERGLGAYVSSGDDRIRVRATGMDPGPPPPVPDADWAAVAMNGRGELEAARATERALDAQAGLAPAAWLRGTSVNGGFKRQSDGLEGWFVGLDVPLPMSDRRRGATEAARAAVDEARARTTLLARAITREVYRAEGRLGSLRRQLTLLNEDTVGGADELLSIARVSYEEGEAGIVELLDAARAFVEARLLHSRVHADSWVAYFDLEAALGGFPWSSEE